MKKLFKDELGIATALTSQREPPVRPVVPVGHGTSSNKEVSTSSVGQRWVFSLVWFRMAFWENSAARATL